MGQVVLTLNGRVYRLACGDGEEERLQALAAYVREKVDALTADLGQIGEARLMLMSALLIADELFEARGGPQRARSTIGARGPAAAAEPVDDQPEFPGSPFAA
jgi:cell division protein ZapA